MLFAACGVDGETFDETNESEQASVSTNGVSINGVSINGVSINGVSVNGVSVNGVSINGTSLTGINTTTGQTYTSSSIGAQLTGTLSNGGTLTLRIDAASTLAAPNTDLWSYGVSYQADGIWKPLCGDPAVRALKVMGTWGTTGAHSASSTTFTFACRGSSIAKCVEMGYKTTATTNQMLSCVRLLRGDYCGTGVPYTVNGNQVNIYDALGIQTDAQMWSAEAEWTPNGARCISLNRKTRFYETGVVPACVTSNSLASGAGCATSGFRNGAVLISEIPILVGPTTTSISAK